MRLLILDPMLAAINTSSGVVGRNGFLAGSGQSFAVVRSFSSAANNNLDRVLLNEVYGETTTNECTRALRQFTILNTIECLYITLYGVCSSITSGVYTYLLLNIMFATAAGVIMALIAGDVRVSSMDITSYPIDFDRGQISVFIADSLPYEYSEDGYFILGYLQDIANYGADLVAVCGSIALVAACIGLTSYLCRMYTVIERYLIPALDQVNPVLRYIMYYCDSTPFLYRTAGYTARYMRMRENLLMRFGLNGLLRGIDETYGYSAFFAVNGIDRIGIEPTSSCRDMMFDLPDVLTLGMFFVPVCSVVAIFVTMAFGVIAAVVIGAIVTITFVMNAEEYGIRYVIRL